MSVQKVCDSPAIKMKLRPYSTGSKLHVSSIVAIWCPTNNISFFLFSILFIYFWLCWVFVATHGLYLVAASGGYSLLWCAGFSLRWHLLLWSTGSRCTGFSSCGMQSQQLWHAGSVVVARGLSCSEACGIFLDQGSNPCPLHWQADS